MKVLLATGIYPPDIGGPATYVENLARELSANGIDVRVLTYRSDRGQVTTDNTWPVIEVAKSGGPLSRWRRYAKALREHGFDADAVIAFSSVSAGVPVILARLKKPKKILRLGGDFFWERYTDRGGMMDLAQWHASARSWMWRLVMQRILARFDHVAYSSDFQKKIHARFVPLRSSSVIENPTPTSSPVSHNPHQPFRLLFVGRFVGFKNLPALVQATAMLTDVCLTLVGDGPMRNGLARCARDLRMGDRVSILPPIAGAKKDHCFDSHDLLILPSLTEISPNVAAEAAARGLPVLLTESTGLCDASGLIVKAALRTPEQIAETVRDVQKHYPSGMAPQSDRLWPVVVEEWMTLIRSFTSADPTPARP